MNYEEFKEKYDLENNSIKSSSWSMGGSWASYTGATGTIEPEPQPQNFNEFDELIEKIVPDISFMKYKKIYAACVRVESKSENDYYGGCEYYGYYECDLYRLYESLDEMGLLEEEY